ncbi:MAG TPA: SDR family oxidoreductase [Pirellulales bacterium]|nr:SDR family oxidoreductase [Pirellulales bacterium]
MTAEPSIQSLFDLTGRTALVTGGTGHLGGALTRALAEAGASVVVTSREADRAAAAAGQLPFRGGARHHGMPLDHQAVDRLADDFAAIAARCGPIDVLVNNGHEPVKADLTTCTGEEFTRQLANATGYFLLARMVRDQAVARGAPASVIMLGSMYGLVASYPDAYAPGAASPVAYHALKGGILQMTRHLAVYWARDRVRVNALSPGPFPAPAVPQELKARLAEKSPMRRMGEAHELKGAVVFLATDASSYVTGHNLIIDGGWTAW